MSKFYDLDYWHRSPKGSVDPSWLSTSEAGKKLAHAIDKKLKVEIVYSGGTTPPMKRIIEPYKLFERLGDNYVESYCYLRQELRTFKIDRINSIKVLYSPQEQYSTYKLTYTPTYEPIRKSAPPYDPNRTSVPHAPESRGIIGWIWIVGLLLLLYLCSKFR